MNKYALKAGLLALVLSLNCGPTRADSLRCGSQLVSTGDRAFEVERKCGSPQYRDLIGYTDSRYGYSNRPEMVVEEWVYGPTNGAFNILRFEGNRLIRIETRREY